MTIDEAIKHAKEISCKNSKCYKYCTNDCSKCEEYHKQLAEWLEELKRLKTETEQDIYERAYAEGRDKGYSCGKFCGYIKAIDAFVKECEAEYDNDGCPGVSDYLDYKLSLREIFEITEQLKEGGK